VGLIQPSLPDFDLDAWRRQPFATRVRMACESWALDGWGSPTSAYLFYAVKLGVFIGGWVWLTARVSPGGLDNVSQWWASPRAVEQAVLWAMLFEGLGLGCGSGPLTARFIPPFGGMLHFARPGTTRLPPWPGRVPLTRGHLRTPVDAALYLGAVAAVVAALLSPRVDDRLLLAIAVLIPLVGLRDRTVFLAFRSEHYLLAVLVFLLADDPLPGIKAVMLAIWVGAALSKVNHHFPNVVTVMLSNSPVMRSRAIRRRLYRDFPGDLRPSRLATRLAHTGTAVEFTFPLVLAFSSGGNVTRVALLVMIAFHLNILSSVPAGVPLEWNVVFIHGAMALFGSQAQVRFWAIDDPLLAVILLVACVVVPIWGNVRPDQLSFLPSMRYYAGNWPVSAWLFRPGALEKIDERIVSVSRTPMRQLAMFYDDNTTQLMLAKAGAFRSMHVHGRLVHQCMALAVDDLDDYQWIEGELIAGIALGWNFGDGHLHQEQLLEALQAQVGWGRGDVVGVFIEGQPLGKPALHWRIVDCVDGLLEEGHADVNDLRQRQPWQPEPTRTG